MKKLHSFAFYALITPAITLGAGSVLADPSADQDMDREPQSTQHDEDARQSDPLTAADRQSTSDQSRKEHRGYLSSAPVDGTQASELMDAEVKLTGDEEVGSVSDLIIDENGQVMAVVVGVGGFLGMGEKDVAIGWGHVTKSGTADDQELRIDVTREGLRSAPNFNAGQSSLTTAQNDPDTLRGDPGSQSGDQSMLDDDPDAQRSRQSDSQRSRMSSDSSLATTDTQGSGDLSRMQNRGYIASAPANGTHASKLIGADVRTSGDEDVGPVNDLIIDENGQVVAVVIGVGGFLGLGERDVAIGWDDVTKSSTSDDEVELLIEATRDSLRSAPEFEDRD